MSRCILPLDFDTRLALSGFCDLLPFTVIYTSKPDGCTSSSVDQRTGSGSSLQLYSACRQLDRHACYFIRDLSMAAVIRDYNSLDCA